MASKYSKKGEKRGEGEIPFVQATVCFIKFCQIDAYPVSFFSNLISLKFAERKQGVYVQLCITFIFYILWN